MSGLLLLPLSGIFRIVLILRSLMYRCGLLKTYRATAPVIVVGNITAGGTGKSPTVIWLVDELKSRGFHPGIVSRGYGGSKAGTSMRVDVDSDAAVVGDEPVMLARRTGCPVVVDSDRVRAAAMLVEDGVDVIVADDGLQHRRLRRDFEICVIDGTRGLGNGRLLPSGPLRESANRLRTVDQILVNGGEFGDGLRFDLVAEDAQRLNGTVTRPLTAFKGTTVHAVAGIGNPQRFFDLLRANSIQVIEHDFPDHASLSPSDVHFGDEFDVVMTEKDAVKLGQKHSDKFWFVPVEFAVNREDSATMLGRLELRLQSNGDPT